MRTTIFLLALLFSQNYVLAHSAPYSQVKVNLNWLEQLRDSTDVDIQALSEIRSDIILLEHKQIDRGLILDKLKNIRNGVQTKMDSMIKIIIDNEIGQDCYGSINTGTYIENRDYLVRARSKIFNLTDLITDFANKIDDGSTTDINRHEIGIKIMDLKLVFNDFILRVVEWVEITNEQCNKM
ncbi:MAG: hypothetical protein KDD58_03880 [Bdellovibrionales bacterium]|nr:hypothetical protein [Bdellovibrionales bacterium]